jgi:hypothetical protein
MFRMHPSMPTLSLLATIWGMLVKSFTNVFPERAAVNQ